MGEKSINMKRKITLLFIAASAAISVNAQVLLQQDFNVSGTNAATLNTSAIGWSVQNNSIPVGTLSPASQEWFQGCPLTSNGSWVWTTPYNGSSHDFASVGFSSELNQTGAISNWLISPTVTIKDGYALQFATRSRGNQTFPNRLQVRVSTTAPYTIGAGVAAVGSFNTLLFDINPAYSTSTVGTVVNGTSTAGYPDVWTVYTVQIPTGTAPAGVTGKIAFRFYVDDASTKGYWIGLDGIKYTGPCITPTLTSYTTCASTSVTFAPQGGVGTVYQWENSANANTSVGSSTTVTSPASGTTIYTVTAMDGVNSCGALYSSTVAVTAGSGIALNVATSTNVICPGETIGFAVTNPGAASSYTWATPSNPALIVGPSQANITINVSGVRVYTVTGSSGSCVGSAIVQVTVLPTPTISAFVNNNNPICAGGGVTITASGGLAYLYAFDPFYFTNYTTSNTRTLTAAQINSLVTYANNNTNDTIYYYVFGADANGCVGEYDDYFFINPAPTIAVVPASTVVCARGGGAISVSGASTYSLTSANTAVVSNTTSTSDNSIVFPTGNIGTSSGIVVSTTITGTDENGCKGSKTQQVRVVNCTGIENIDGNVETSVYPNPFTNELYVDALVGRVEIYNAIGQVVMSVSVKENGTINTESLAKGVYVLKAFNEQGHVVKATKLMKD